MVSFISGYFGEYIIYATTYRKLDSRVEYLEVWSFKAFATGARYLGGRGGCRIPRERRTFPKEKDILIRRYCYNQAEAMNIHH